MKKCTKGKRHKWQWKKNVVVKRIFTKYIEVKLCGLYRCKCGAEKFGMAPLKGGRNGQD